MTLKTLLPRTGWESPLAGVVEMQDEMHRLLDTFFGRRGLGWVPTDVMWFPPLDVYDRGEALVVRAELPGVRQEEIDISINDNILTLKGERKPDPEVKEESYYRRERSYGPFHRTLTLPSMVDTATVKASYREGVLEILLPKKEEARPRAIKVEAA